MKTQRKNFFIVIIAIIIIISLSIFTIKEVMFPDSTNYQTMNIEGKKITYSDSLNEFKSNHIIEGSVNFLPFYLNVLEIDSSDFDLNSCLIPNYCKGFPEEKDEFQSLDEYGCPIYNKYTLTEVCRCFPGEVAKTCGITAIRDRCAGASPPCGQDCSTYDYILSGGISQSPKTNDLLTKLQMGLIWKDNCWKIDDISNLESQMNCRVYGTMESGEIYDMLGEVNWEGDRFSCIIENPIEGQISEGFVDFEIGEIEIGEIPIEQIEGDLQDYLDLLEKYKGDLETLGDILDALEISIDEKRQLIEQLDLNLLQQGQIINELEITLEEKIQMIQDLTNSIEEQNLIISALELTLEEKKQIVEELNQDIEAQAQFINTLSQNLAEKIVLIESLTSENEEQANLIEQMRLSFSDQADIINNLNKKIEDDAEIISNLGLSLEEEGILISELELTISEQAELIKELNLELEEEAIIIKNLKLTISEQAELIKALNLELEEESNIIAKLELNLDEEKQLVEELIEDLNERKELVSKVQEEKAKLGAKLIEKQNIIKILGILAGIAILILIIFIIKKNIKFK